MPQDSSSPSPLRSDRPVLFPIFDRILSLISTLVLILTHILICILFLFSLILLWLSNQDHIIHGCKMDFKGVEGRIIFKNLERS